MKLNKPKTTSKNVELESYVVSLLTDTTVLNNQTLNNERAIVATLPNIKKVSTSYRSYQPESTFVKEKFVTPLIKEKDNESAVRNKTNEKTITQVKLESNESPITEVKNTEFNKAFVNKEKLKAEPNIGLKAEIKEPLDDVKKNVLPKYEVSHQDKINHEIKNYSNRAFKEEEEKKDPRLVGVEKLLTKIALADVIIPNAKPLSEVSSQNNSIEQPRTSASLSEKSAEASFGLREKAPLKNTLGDEFQTLVFDVNQLPLAVPLVKLGGIVSLSTEDITPLVGTPDWFLGLVRGEEGNLMVVDTQLFLMPDKIIPEESEYRYLIILDDSKWALACHSVGDAKNLLSSDIRWSSKSSKRPWFAGMVVEYMSALLEVDELINLLADNVID